ncbi:MAG TPA: pyrroloquinoline quinone precursor peptide PqqA [Alphaproteobacteria bacterium]
MARSFPPRRAGISGPAGISGFRAETCIPLAFAAFASRGIVYSRGSGEEERRGHSPASGRARCVRKEVRMWKKPCIVEIAVGLEINSYACAELD